MKKSLIAVILLCATECVFAMVPMIKNKKVVVSLMNRLASTVPNDMQQIVIGEIYKHYKGGLYQVKSLDRKTEGVYKDPHANSEDSSQLRVSYQALNSPAVFGWTREYEEFAGSVEVDGKLVERFKKIDKDDKEVKSLFLLQQKRAR